MNAFTRPLNTVVQAVIWTPYKAVAALAGIGLTAVTDGATTSRDAGPGLVITVAVLAAADITAWWLDRPNDRVWLLTMTNPDGSPYVAPWGEDCGMAIDDQDELRTRVAAVEAAGLVPNVRRA